MSKERTSSPTSSDGKSTPPEPGPSAARLRMGPLDVLIFAGWCGLAAGLLEVVTRLLCRFINPTDRLYGVSRHFVWCSPLVYLLLFLVIGVFWAALAWLWPRGGGWLSRRLIVASALAPSLIVASPEIYVEAWLIVALGLATRIVPFIEWRPRPLRRWLLWSFPGLLGLVVVLAASVFAGDWLKEKREAGRPPPPADSPNVLLIVMDTVRADRLSLYGYYRPTSPALEQFAKRGIRFDNVRTTAPWTLPSHASMFTGHWPHELGAEWMTPVRSNFPTLAEYLGSHGFATAGFAANTLFCSYETGLDRGFAHYEDYELGPLAAARTASVVNMAFKFAFAPASKYGRRAEPGLLRLLQDAVLDSILAKDRISGQAINRKFLDWLAPA